MQTELTNIFNWIRFSLYLFCYGIYKCHRINNVKKELSILHIHEYLKKRYLVISLKKINLKYASRTNS
jgi:hypothetical protein